MNLLVQLKQYTQVVADTGDFESMKQYQPVDATTNPSLIFAAAKKPEYAHLVDQAIEFGKKGGGTSDQRLNSTLDMLAVLFGMEILKTGGGGGCGRVCTGRLLFSIGLCKPGAAFHTELSFLRIFCATFRAFPLQLRTTLHAERSL